MAQWRDDPSYEHIRIGLLTAQRKTESPILGAVREAMILALVENRPVELRGEDSGQLEACIDPAALVLGYAPKPGVIT